MPLSWHLWLEQPRPSPFCVLSVRGRGGSGWGEGNGINFVGKGREDKRKSQGPGNLSCFCLHLRPLNLYLFPEHLKDTDVWEMCVFYCDQAPVTWQGPGFQMSQTYDFRTLKSRINTLSVSLTTSLHSLSKQRGGSFEPSSAWL